MLSCVLHTIVNTVNACRQGHAFHHKQANHIDLRSVVRGHSTQGAHPGICQSAMGSVSTASTCSADDELSCATAPAIDQEKMKPWRKLETDVEGRPVHRLQVTQRGTLPMIPSGPSAAKKIYARCSQSVSEHFS